jgi:hypothetical protein
LHRSSCMTKSQGCRGFLRTKAGHNTGQKIPAFGVPTCHSLALADN